MQNTINLRKNKRTTANRNPSKENQAKPNAFWISYRKSYQSKNKVILTAIFIFIIATSFIYFRRNILLGIFLIMVGVVMLLSLRVSILKNRVYIVRSGIKIDDRFYPYRDIKSFWVSYEPGGLKELSIELNSWYTPYIRLAIDPKKVNPLSLRSFLLKFVPEKEHEDSLVNLTVRKLGL